MKMPLLLLLCLFMENNPDFVKQQKNYPRVRNAYQAKETLLRQQLEKAGLSFDNIHILITAYKQEGVLNINYPNSSDRLKSKASNLGGSICIHGNCVTVGCLPMTDDKIKEIYLYAVQARQCGQKNIPVYIFPFKFTDQKVKQFKDTYKAYPFILDFWDNLREGHDLFIKELKELNVSVDRLGNYLFTK